MINIYLVGTDEIFAHSQKIAVKLTRQNHEEVQTEKEDCTPRSCHLTVIY